MTFSLADLTEDEMFVALKSIHRTNDMLPPREDDKVAERIGKRFIRALHAKIGRDEYLPERAHFVPVAKSRVATRPAAVVSLEDRVVYEALVARTRVRINRHLLPATTVLWPRSDDSKQSWTDFENAPLAVKGTHVVMADVAGFYESIAHSHLRSTLIEIGIEPDLAAALCSHLLSIMGSPRGLPQGLATSDALATACLSQTDSALRADNVIFWRHGDDYRAHADSFSEALRNTHLIEAAVRRAGLLLNQKKMRVIKYSRYEEWLNDVTNARAAFQATLHAARVSSAREMDDDELGQLANEVELDEDMQWRYFYHGIGDVSEVIDALAPLLAPKPVEVLEQMFVALFEGSDKSLVPELWHGRFTFCIQHLAGAKSKIPLKYALELLSTKPSESQTVANYLLAAQSVDPQAVAEVCQRAIRESPYLTEWETGWILRVLSRTAHYIDPKLLAELELIVMSDAHGWFHRVEAARVLAAAGHLTLAMANLIRTRGGSAFASDIVGIVAARSTEYAWSKAFLDGAKINPLFAVVIQGVTEKAGIG